MPKRKRATIASVEAQDAPHIPPAESMNGTRRKSQRNSKNAAVNPDINPDVVDAPAAIRASPDAEQDGVGHPNGVNDVKEEREAPKARETKRAKRENADKTPAKKDETKDAEPVEKKASKQAKDEETRGDPEAEDDMEDADPEEVKEALSRPPAVNSDYLPLPWKGRLGYACLCTYLRYSNPPVFSSRTTRIASILEHRHPLADPTQPEHPTKNRPDKNKPADVRLGQEFIERLCLANVRDMAKTLRWNDKYGIRFLRLSSEAFPFASHAEYGYKLAPFASEALAEVGKVVAELGHRVTTHPGQFTQLGSPRKPVIDASIRDLEYHDEMLSLLKLPPQQDRDAVMILHMGGAFGDKAATLDRFRENYSKLSDSIKRRLVLENDDMCWGVHDLLPICKELNIPFVLDFHHNNIIFDPDQIREGTKDIIELFPEIRETWTRKGITQKMHYSEPTPAAITPKQRRKHNPRVATLPPCPNDMDLMIEAKDKEQAVFELMRTFKLPGWDTFSDIVPFVRSDDNKVLDQRANRVTPKKPKKPRKGETAPADDEDQAPENENPEELRIPEAEIGMGGPQGRVYWPPSMEEWLRPQKRQIKKKETGANETPKKAGKDQEQQQVALAPEVNGKVDEAKSKKPSRAAATKGNSRCKKEITPLTSEEED